MSAEQRGRDLLTKIRRSITIDKSTRKLLKKTPPNRYIEVFLGVTERHQPEPATGEGRTIASREAAKKDLAGVEQVLEQVKEVDGEVSYTSIWANRTMRVTAPKGLINVLADRQDVKSVFDPGQITRDI